MATVLLLHCDGTNGSTTFTDATGKTVTPNGNAQISTAQSKFGGASALFDGSGDYLSLADSPDWDLGTGDFTLDFWVRFNTLKNAGFVFVGTSDAEGVSVFYSNASHLLRVFVAGSPANDQAWTASAATWYHVAVVRQATGDGKIHSYINGTELGSGTTNAANITVTSGLYVGRDAGDSSIDCDGWLDEIRVVKGTAAWTANFTPPAAAYVLAANQGQMFAVF